MMLYILVVIIFLCIFMKKDALFFLPKRLRKKICNDEVKIQEKVIVLEFKKLSTLELLNTLEDCLSGKIEVSIYDGNKVVLELLQRLHWEQEELKNAGENDLNES